MVDLASGQQMAERLGIAALKPEDLFIDPLKSTVGDAERKELTGNTPLWFYILREAELNGGKLTGVGARITAEVFHRAMEGSQISIVRDPAWRPIFGPDRDTFRMTDLLMFAFEKNPQLLNPLDD
jgi:hypothetical protein